AFTGSTAVGRHIYRLGADRIKKLHLELGGSDAAIVCADSDLEAAARAVAWSAFLNAGQVCTSAERIYVEQPVHAEFLERFAELTRSLVVGPGVDERTEVTPLIGRQEGPALLRGDRGGERLGERPAGGQPGGAVRGYENVRLRPRAG